MKAQYALFGEENNRISLCSWELHRWQASVYIGAHRSAAKRGLSKWVLWDLEDMS